MRKGDIEGRFDPIYYCGDIFGFLKKTQYSIKRIKDVTISLKSGFGAGKQDQDQDGKGIIQIRPTNMGNEGNLKFDRNIYLPLILLSTEQENILKKGDVLFNNTNSQSLVGKTVYFDEDGDFLFSNHITRIKVKKNEILPKFLTLLLNALHSKKVFFSICTNWNNQSGVGIELLRYLKIPVPFIETQAEIVTLFETAYTAKKQKETKAAELLASIDGYLLQQLGITLPPPSEKNNSFKISFSKVSSGRFDPAYFDAKFSLLRQSIETGNYQTVPVGKVCSLLASGKTPAKLDYSDNPTAYPIIKVASYSGDTIDLNKTDYANNSQPYTVQKGDIFVLSAAHQAEYVGRFVKQLDENPIIKTSFVGELICLRANPSIVNPNYLFALFSSSTFQTLMNCEKRGQTSHIYSKDIKHILIPLPPPEKQTEIANHISAIRTLAKQLQQQASAELEQAKQHVEHLILGE